MVLVPSEKESNLNHPQIFNYFAMHFKSFLQYVT